MADCHTSDIGHWFAMTEAERICVSFRDQSADWSWESVIPQRKGRGERIATASDIGHWFAMTHYKKCGVSPDGRTEASAPTECNKRCNGRATARVAPTEALQEVRWAGRCRHRPLRMG